MNQCLTPSSFHQFSAERQKDQHICVHTDIWQLNNTSRKEKKSTYARKSNVRALFSDNSWQLVSCTLGNQVSKQISWENSWGWDLGCCCHRGRLAGTADADSPGWVQIFQEANYSCLLEMVCSSLLGPPPRQGARDSQRQILKAPEKHRLQRGLAWTKREWKARPKTKQDFAPH